MKAKKPRVLWQTMNGSHGCMPDCNEIFHTKKDALEFLSNLFELSEERERELRKYCYLDMKPEDGAAYCEIIKIEGKEVNEFIDENNEIIEGNI